MTASKVSTKLYVHPFILLICCIHIAPVCILLSGSLDLKQAHSPEGGVSRYLKCAHRMGASTHKTKESGGRGCSKGK